MVGVTCYRMRYYPIPSHQVPKTVTNLVTAMRRRIEDQMLLIETGFSPAYLCLGIGPTFFEKVQRPKTIAPGKNRGRPVWRENVQNEQPHSSFCFIMGLLILVRRLYSSERCSERVSLQRRVLRRKPRTGRSISS